MLFAQRGIAPQHRFGQNFLVDLNIHDLIVKTAELGPEDVVLEIVSRIGVRNEKRLFIDRQHLEARQILSNRGSGRGGANSSSTDVKDGR